MAQVAVSKEILNLKGIKLLFVIDNLHWPYFSLFCDQSCRTSFFKDADLWQHKFDFAG